MAEKNNFKEDPFNKNGLLKLNIVLNRTFRSISRLSIGLLLLSAALLIFDNGYYLSYQYVIGFGLFTLLLSSCMLIKNRFLMGAVRTILSALVLITFFLYSLYDIYKMGYGIDIGKVFEYNEVPIIFIICWLITIITSCKNIKNDLKLPRYNHIKSLKFFKGFSIFLAIFTAVVTVLYLVINYESAIAEFFPILLNYYQFLLIYLIAQIVIVKTTNECIYADIKPIDEKNHLPKMITFGAIVAAAIGFFIAIRHVLNEMLLKFLSSLINAYYWCLKYFELLVKHVERILKAIQARPPRKPLPSDLSDTQGGILKDFGFGNLKPNQPGGGFGGGSGGIGGLGGSGGIGGLGGSGGIGGNGQSIGNGAGSISGAMSQSGELGLGGGSLPEGGNKAAMAFVKAEKDAYVYLKLKSFGDYNGKGWDDANAYAEYLVEDSTSYSMNYLSGTALYNSGMQSIMIEISSLTGQYFLPDYIAMGEFPYVIQNSDVMSIGDTSDVYGVEFYSYSGYDIDGYVNTKYFMNEQNYRYYVHINYLKLPEETKNQVKQFLEEQGIDANSSTIVQDVLKVFAQYTYNRQYNQDVDAADDVVMSFLTEYKEGICQHFASSAVVMYRSLGIPARYVGGLYVGRIKGGEWNVVTADAAHAWVEIYLDGVGWIRVDPTSYARVVGETVDGTYSSSEYKQEILNNQNSQNQGGSGYNPGIGGGSGNNSGDITSAPDIDSGEYGEDSSTDIEDSSFAGGEDSSFEEDSSTGGGEDSSFEEDSSTGGGEDSSFEEDSSTDGGEDSSFEEDSSTGGGEDSSFEEDKESSFEESSVENPWKDSEGASSEQLIHIGLFEGCDFENVPWGTIGIVGGVLLTSALAFALLAYLKKNGKKRVKKAKTVVENISVETIDGNNTEITDEEVLAATQIIRENYKEFIKIAGKYGIRRYPVDTTQSLRSKYDKAIGPNEAMEILTVLYRIARYNKNERLSMADANQSKMCLDIIKRSFEEPDENADE